MLDQIKSLLGDASKWVFIAIIGIAVILGIVLFSIVMANIQTVLIVGGAVAVAGIVGYILYLKFKKPATPVV
jgi:uncharacterized membrane protein HdeD (DUF308 family)